MPYTSVEGLRRLERYVGVCLLGVVPNISKSREVSITSINKYNMYATVELAFQSSTKRTYW